MTGIILRPSSNHPRLRPPPLAGTVNGSELVIKPEPKSQAGYRI